MAQAWNRPGETATAGGRPWTITGTGVPLRLVVPCPNSPSRFWPQQRTAPEGMREHVKLTPAETIGTVFACAGSGASDPAKNMDAATTRAAANVLVNRRRFIGYAPRRCCTRPRSEARAEGRMSESGVSLCFDRPISLEHHTPEFRSRVHVELAVGAGQVRPHSLDGHKCPRGDVLVGQARRSTRTDPLLGRRQERGCATYRDARQLAASAVNPRLHAKALERGQRF